MSGQHGVNSVTIISGQMHQHPMQAHIKQRSLTLDASQSFLAFSKAQDSESGIRPALSWLEAMPCGHLYFEEGLVRSPDVGFRAFLNVFAEIPANMLNFSFD